MFQNNNFDFLKFIIIGKIKTISTSKIKKIIAIKKNRKENGNRDDLIGSNPHSKGDNLFWFSMDLKEIIDANEFSIVDKINDNIIK